MLYATAEPEDRYRLASTTDTKNRVVERLVEKHRGDQTLVIGQYLDQLDELGEPHRRAGDQGRDAGQGARAAVRGLPHGEEHTLVVSQGRQLLGRPARGRRGDPGVGHLRVAAGGGAAARAASCGRSPTAAARASTPSVSRDTLDQDYAAHRQRFLAEQGYAYRIVDADDILSGNESPDGPPPPN
jgi:DNA excision repair protein ERCC-3